MRNIMEYSNDFLGILWDKLDSFFILAGKQS